MIEVQYIAPALVHIGGTIGDYGINVKKKGRRAEVSINGALSFARYRAPVVYEDVLTVMRDVYRGDASVKEVAVTITSPGGSVMGAWDTMDELFELAKLKPTTVYVPHYAASGGYAMATALASHWKSLIASPNAELGSVDAVITRIDESKMLDRVGVAVHFFTGGKGAKVWGHPETPLSEAEAAYWGAKAQADSAAFRSRVVGYGYGSDEFWAEADGRMMLANTTVCNKVAVIRKGSGMELNEEVKALMEAQVKSALAAQAQQFEAREVAARKQLETQMAEMVQRAVQAERNRSTLSQALLAGQVKADRVDVVSKALEAAPELFDALNFSAPAPAPVASVSTPVVGAGQIMQPGLRTTPPAAPTKPERPVAELKAGLLNGTLTEDQILEAL